MKFTKFLGSVVRGPDAVIKLLSRVACGVLIIMVMAVVVHVFGRFFLHKPLLGIVELIELMMVITIFFAIPYTAAEKRHVRVDLVISRLPRRPKAILDSIAFSLGTVIFALITYQAIVLTIYYARDLSNATDALSIPFAPFRAVMALGCLLFCLKMLTDAVYVLIRAQEEK